MTPLQAFEIGLAIVAAFVATCWVAAWLLMCAVRGIQTRHVVLDKCPWCGQDMDFHREHNGCVPIWQACWINAEPHLCDDTDATRRKDTLR